jgi:hypothetical protein
MKNPCNTPCLLFFCIFCSSCAFSDREGPFLLEFPPLPAAWTDLLGEPRWLVRYYGGDGREASLEGEGAFSLPPSAAGPVFAWPYWPVRRLEPGDFRPAGGILPYDGRPPDGAADSRRLSLSWQGGVDAWFYRALSGAISGEGDVKVPSGGMNFNWPRFRTLFSDPSVPQEIQEDPWRADWEDIAESTVHSGFRKQRLKAVETTDLPVPVHPGPWISASPFTPALEFGTGPRVFPVGPGPAVSIWYSAQGILHCSGESWMLLPWE